MLIPSDTNRFAAPAAAPPPDLSAVPEPELVRAARGGDDTAFGEIYRRYHTRLTKFACLRLHDWPDAEDVAQDTLLKAWRVIAGGDERLVFTLNSWLHTICARKCIDLLRSRRHRSTASLESWCERYRSHSGGDGEGADDAYLAADRDAFRLESRHEPRLRLARPSRYEQPEEAAAIGERVAVVRAALGRLPERHRVYVLEQVEQGIGMRATAGRHGVSLPAVKGIVFRAYRLLRTMPDVAALAP